MSQENREVEVLIVGAGPAGMVLASELQRHGVRCRIIDRLPEPSQTSKALGVQARTLELFEKMGIVERFLDEGVRLTAMNIHGSHRRLGQIRLDYAASHYPFMLALPQWRTEHILGEHLREQGIAVERNVALTALVQTATGVEVVLDRGDGHRETAHPRWVIGCDGPHSTVRHLLGLSFEGWTFEQSFALADVRMGCPLPAHEAALFWRGGDFIGCFPLPDEQYRLVIGYRPCTGPEGDVTPEELDRALARCGWSRVRVDEMVWSSRFHVNQRKVRHYRQGSAFLVGDACHIHSPIGGQGMNAGIQDAFNLAWKLALVSRGEARPRVIDSYETERERFGRRLLRDTNLVAQLALLQGPLSSRLRDGILPVATNLKPVGRWVASRIAQMDVCYRGSPIVRDHRVGHRLDLGGIRRGAWRAGARAPDLQVRLGGNPIRTHLLCLGTRHVLFFVADRRSPDHSLQAWQEVDGLIRGAYPGLIEAWLVLPRRSEEAERVVTRVLEDRDAALARAHGISEDGLVLVRPDGHIGFLSHPSSLEHLRSYLAGVFVGSRDAAGTTEVEAMGRPTLVPPVGIEPTHKV